jgi:hypothetical protein
MRHAINGGIALFIDIPNIASPRRREGPGRIDLRRDMHFVAVHDALGLTKPVTRVFPREDPSRMISSSDEIQVTDAMLLSSWPVSLMSETVGTAETSLECGACVSFLPFGTTEVTLCQDVTTRWDPLNGKLLQQRNVSPGQRGAAQNLSSVTARALLDVGNPKTEKGICLCVWRRTWERERR